MYSSLLGLLDELSYILSVKFAFQYDHGILSR